MKKPLPDMRGQQAKECVFCHKPYIRPCNTQKEASTCPNFVWLRESKKTGKSKLTKIKK